MATKEQIVENFPSIDNFSKGLNLFLNEQIIGIDEAVIAQNVDISGGSLKRCDGYTKIDDNGLPIGDKKLLKHYDAGNGSLLVAVGDKMYKKDGKEYKVIKSGLKSHKYNYVNYQFDDEEITIMTNGKDDVVMYDGDKFTDVKHDGKSSSSSSTNKSPKGKYVTLHKERLWIAGNEKDVNNVYFSKDFDFHDWTHPEVGESEVNEHGGIISIPTWDGGIIIGMKSLFDDVVIFKNKNVFRIFGTYPGNYNLIQVFDTVDGDILQGTIASLENTALWTSTNGIHVFNGTNAEFQSYNVKGIFDRMTKGSEHKAVATISKRKYILSMAVDGSTENNIIIEYDMQSKAFTTKTDHGASSFVEIDERLYFSNQEGNIFEYGVGDTFNGKPIHLIWENGFNAYGEQQARKIINRVYFRAGGSDSVKISSITENKEVTKILKLTDEIKFYRERLRNKGRFVKLRIENVNGGKIELNQLQFMLDLDYD